MWEAVPQEYVNNKYGIKIVNIWDVVGMGASEHAQLKSRIGQVQASDICSIL